MKGLTDQGSMPADSYAELVVFPSPVAVAIAGINADFKRIKT